MNMACPVERDLNRYQRTVDREAQVELDMERLEQEMRESLLTQQEFPLTYRDGFARKTVCYESCDVLNEMWDLDPEAFDLALRLMDTDPLEMARQLQALRARAVEQLIGRAPLREAAEYEDNEL